MADSTAPLLATPAALPLRGRGGLRRLPVALWRHRYLYLMLLPPLVYFLVFRFYPILGNVIAFKDYRLAEGIYGSEWAGLKHFETLFGDEAFWRALRNTVSIALLKLLFAFPAPIVLALFINEIRSVLYKRFLQTIVYAPHFLSWVIYGAILYIVLSPVNGVVNNAMAALGFEKIAFFQVPAIFQPIVVASTILKESGWAAVIYLAAISTIDPQLYEAAQIDGANRWRLMWHVTLPGLATVIMTLLILQLGWFLNVGFAQLFILQNNIVLPTGDIIETFIYRVGIQRARFDFTTAAGLFNSAVGLILVLVADRIAKRMGLRGIL
ncbi:MAG TPA: ABC transporter permease subunit [Chloroflexota bacterium]|nr:ABC transporter permease subunit [Chloroflexota bacterium]